MRGRREVLVAAAPAAAFGHEQRLVGLDQLAEDLAGISVADLGSGWHRQEHIVAGLACHVFALAVLPSFSHPPSVISVIEQCREIRIDFHEYASTRSTVTTIRPALRDELLSSDCGFERGVRRAVRIDVTVMATI